MTATIGKLNAALETMGSTMTFHREQGGTSCPCRTPEGFRDPAYHHINPTEPDCNEQGMLDAVVNDFIFKGSIQGALTRQMRESQIDDRVLASINADDKLGIFPCSWNGHTLDFTNWSEAGEDYVLYDGHRYTIVAADKWPDVDGDPNHHWECGLRLLDGERPS